MKKPNILILGSMGMLGQDVSGRFNELVLEGKVNSTTCFDRNDIPFDLADRESMSSWCRYVSEVRYDFCINCTAYTDTKSEETTKEGDRLGYLLNSIYPKNIAHACEENGIRLIHISTDYVFSELTKPESKDGLRYTTKQNPSPKNRYGLHKLLGELNIGNEMRNTDYSIIRTSWIYSTGNNKSFIHKFLSNCIRRCLSEKDGRIIHDITMTSNEHSMPTSCRFLTDIIEKLVFDFDSHSKRIIHAVPVEPDRQKLVSRYDFAKEILENLLKITKNNELRELISSIQLNPVETYSYYPHNSTLESSYPCRNWKRDLAEFMSENIDNIEKHCMKTINEIKNSNNP